MQYIEDVTKIIANIAAIGALLTGGIAVVRYFYDKRKDTNDRIRKGYMPLYEYFFWKRNVDLFIKNEIALVICTYKGNLIDIIKDNNKLDRSVLPFKILKLLFQYEFYMDIIDSGITDINTIEAQVADCDINDELLDIDEIKEFISSQLEYDIEWHDRRNEGVTEYQDTCAADYVYMVKKATGHAIRVYKSIEKEVFRKIGKPKYNKINKKTNKAQAKNMLNRILKF